MNTQKSKTPDFDHPSFFFVLEDKLKNYFGCRYFYEKDIIGLNLQGNETILDFGCGGGNASRCILQHLNNNGQIVGVDTSAYWIEIAKKRLSKYANARCLTGDIREMNLAAGNFDLIVIFHVLHDIADGDRKSYLRTLAGLLKKEGRVFLREPTRESHGISVREIRTLLAEAGLKEIRVMENSPDYRGIAVLK